MRLTKSRVDGLAPTESAYFVWDDELKGFGLKVHPTGRKAYVVQYRVRGERQPRRVTLGVHGVVKTEQARQKAWTYLGQANDGTDPVAHRQRNRAVATVAEVVPQFLVHLDEVGRAPRYVDEVRRALERYVIPTIGSRAIDSIDREAARSLTRPIVAEKPTMANRLQAALSSMLTWAERNGYIPSNPILGMEKSAPERRRDRVLKDGELRAVWKVSGELGYPWGPFVRLLILTGARRDELAGMQWSELDANARLWVIGRDRTKNSRPHFVPLGDLALNLIDALPRNGELVFSTTGRTQVSGFSKVLKRLHKLSQTSGWSLHDLRRTFRTSLSRLRVPRHVAEMMIGHAQAGLLQVYDHYEFGPEKAEAISKHDAFILEISA